ncbi:RNA-directed DNA polymerase, partial [bacterium AH-315-J21]|nr:RNA-directed DNA polymerase [bacterium AH-315-J21]
MSEKIFLPFRIVMSNTTLDLFGLPRISGLRELSKALRFSPSLLYRLIVFHDKYYFRFEVPKKSGSKRIIKCPSREMKAAQAWILENILSKLTISEHATAFHKGATIVENARRHLRHPHLLRFDLEDFFDYIHHNKIVRVFVACGYSFQTARLLTALCICDGCLPQGGVTSPCLSNLVTVTLDKRIVGLVCSKQIEYTRYADDLIFSSSNIIRLTSTRKHLVRIIEDEGFKLNIKKTKVSGPGSRRKVTGLILGAGRVG